MLSSYKEEFGRGTRKIQKATFQGGLKLVALPQLSDFSQQDEPIA